MNPEGAIHVVNAVNAVRDSIKRAINHVSEEGPLSSDIIYVSLKSGTIFYENLLRNEEHKDDRYIEQLDAVALRFNIEEEGLYKK